MHARQHGMCVIFSLNSTGIKKRRRRIRTTDMRFVGKCSPVGRSGNLYINILLFISSAVGLIFLAGARFNVSDIMLSQWGWCTLRGERCQLVCAFKPSDCKIGHTVRSTCVYVRKLLEATYARVRFYIEIYTEGSHDETHGKVSSTCVYVYKYVEEECRIAKIGSNLLHSIICEGRRIELRARKCNGNAGRQHGVIWKYLSIFERRRIELRARKCNGNAEPQTQ